MANTFRKIYKKTGSSGTSSDYELTGVVGVNGIELDIMRGATSSSDGEIGLVPKPIAGQEDYILTGNGVWRKRSELFDYIIEKIYTNITTDNFGFFTISQLYKDINDGYLIISAYAKDEGLESSGDTCFPIFTVDGANKVMHYGYIYRGNGKAFDPVQNAINITMVVRLLKTN